MTDILEKFWEIMEMEEEKFKTMAVAYIDVLGTKALETFEEQNDISKIFHTAIDEEERRGTPNKKCSRWSFSFSDCAFIIYTQNKQTDSRLTYYDKDDEYYYPLIALLTNLPLTILQYYNRGFLVRGGIAIGDGFVSNDHRRFFGKVFADSSQFDKTGYPPFICIDKELAEKINSIMEKCHKRCVEDAQKKTPEVFKELQLEGLYDYYPYFEKVGDNYIFNVFHNYMTHITALAGNKYIENEETFYNDFKNKCKTNVENAPNDNVKAKWETMLQFLAEKELFINKQLANRVRGFFCSLEN